LITRGTPSFDESGLKLNSVIKLNKISTIKTVLSRVYWDLQMKSYRQK
jgi:hypothetical protein